MERDTNYQFRLLYAFGISFVVLGHLGNTTFHVMTDWFPWLSFHLGMFAFSSGYFFKREKAARLFSFVAHKTRTLIVPLYLWNFAYALLSLLLARAGFSFAAKVTPRSLFLLPLIDGHQFGLNLGSWFLVPLFCCHVYAAVTRKLSGRFCKNWIYTAAGIAIGIAGVEMARRGLRSGWWLFLTRFMYFLPFYELGILYRSRLEKADTSPSWLYFSVVLALQLLVIFAAGTAPVCIPGRMEFPSAAVLSLAGGFLAVAFWLRVARMLVPVLGQSRLVAAVGENTFSIMMHHFFGFFCLKTFFALLHKFTPLCQSFSWLQYKNDMWYIFLPKNCSQMAALYYVAALAISIAIGSVTRRIAAFLRKREPAGAQLTKPAAKAGQDSADA